MGLLHGGCLHQRSSEGSCTKILLSDRTAGSQHGQPAEVQLGVATLVRRLELQLGAGQAASMADLADAAALWRLRNRHAAHRPRGWRSDPAARIPWRCLIWTQPPDRAPFVLLSL